MSIFAWRDVVQWEDDKWQVKVQGQQFFLSPSFSSSAALSLSFSKIFWFLLLSIAETSQASFNSKLIQIYPSKFDSDRSNGSLSSSSTRGYQLIKVRVAFLLHEFWWYGLFWGSKGWVQLYIACICFVVKETCENEWFLMWSCWFQFCPWCLMLAKWCMMFVLCGIWCG